MSNIFFSPDTTALQWYFGKYQFKVGVYVPHANIKIRENDDFFQYDFWQEVGIDEYVKSEIALALWTIIHELKKINSEFKTKSNNCSVIMYSNDISLLETFRSRVIEIGIDPCNVISKQCLNQHQTVREKNVIFQRNPKYVKRVFIKRKIKHAEAMMTFIKNNEMYTNVNYGLESLLNDHPFYFLHGSRYIDFSDEKICIWFLLEFYDDIVNTSDIKKLPAKTDT